MTDLEQCAQRVGTTLRDKWKLERLIGVGGMAAVYVAAHKIGRRDAIKILHA
ncbi:serine/threonine protein kinase, partial [Clostridioides difficile]|nr:serine/threonine protein kinase [Clostridioides difficile]